MEHLMVSQEDSYSTLRELTDTELDNVSGGLSFEAAGYKFEHTGIAGGGSMTTITKGGSYVYYDVCWPK
ncbi:hypothetical protein V6582_21005 (plasmid) [Agrobacterium vitis]|uniref:hypothetical protein n=1 Tax=Agrobacterium vitis TaxID=373 RepID=UPI0012E78333|nr:hypothetical protein [Agrobacterium vitis]MVA27398.1 hypothetical protein [Agrobacterium vitis]